MEAIDFSGLVRPFILSAIFAYGLTEAIKPVVWKYTNDTFGPTIVRILALATGAGCGAMVSLDAEVSLAGAGGGALSAVVVAALKKMIAKKTDG